MDKNYTYFGTQDAVRQAASQWTHQQPKGLFGRVKDSLLGLMFEENKSERPIGISQINPKTFQAAEPEAPGVFFRNNQTYQDFRFTKLSEFKPTPDRSQQA